MDATQSFNFNQFIFITRKWNKLDPQKSSNHFIIGGREIIYLYQSFSTINNIFLIKERKQEDNDNTQVNLKKRKEKKERKKQEKKKERKR